MTAWPKRCVRCTQLIYPASRVPPHRSRHQARCLCGPCYDHCRRAGTLADYRPVTYSRDELMDEWEVLRLHGYSKRQAAERLGMSFAAFDRAFHRARKDDDPRAVNGPADRPREPKRHTKNTYKKSGCRCDQCRAANTAAHRAKVVEWAERRVEIGGRMVAAWLPPEAHGRWTAYSNYRCRCVPCTEAGSVANGQRRARRKVLAG